jgi:hypothetical protein
MPIEDDPTIPDEAIVLRVLHPNWITTKGGRTRPTSHALLELGGTGECSCFIASGTILSKLAAKFPGLSVARIPAAVLRENNFAVRRQPEDCPADLVDDHGIHVVVGPPDGCNNHQTEKRARAIVRDARVTIQALATVIGAGEAAG